MANRLSLEPRVLVVEDDEQVGAVLAAQLEHLGCTITLTEDASEFLAEITRPGATFDLAIVDINLPGLRGTEVITWIRQSDVAAIRDLPILVVTGFPTDLPRRFCLEQGNCHILVKPYPLASLARHVAACEGSPHHRGGRMN